MDNENLQFAGTLQIWRNELVLVLSEGLTPRLEELGTKYYINFEEHRNVENIPEYKVPEFLGYRINRGTYPERIRRIIKFEDRYYYLSQSRVNSNEKRLTFFPLSEGEESSDWKKFSLSKEDRIISLYDDEA